MDATDPYFGGNAGLFAREKFTRGSRTVDMEGAPLVDVCQIERYILNGVEIRFKFWPSKSSLHLMAEAPNAAFVTHIEEATLKVCRVTPTAHMLTAHQETLNRKHMALYPYIKSDLKRFTVAKGSHDFVQDDIFQSTIPSRVIIGMISNEALNGSYRFNPFNFKNYKARFIQVCVDGESVPAKALQCRFGDIYTEGNYVDAYMSLSRDIGKGKRSTV